jgi:hypothetical protein
LQAVDGLPLQFLLNISSSLVAAVQTLAVAVRVVLERLQVFPWRRVLQLL